MKEGDTAPSVKPSKKRVAPKLAKLLEAPRHISTPPHRMLHIRVRCMTECNVEYKSGMTNMVIPTNRVIGSRLIK